ncbi:MAG: hypothetical protein JO353_11705 [Phycisphaerae bacterium]|nr:hypothetical protein [Phycisphaerae bacterium]
MFSTKYQKEFLVPFFYYAPVPYTSTVSSPNIQPPPMKSVMDFLAWAQKTIALPADPKAKEAWQGPVAMKFRYGWEYEANWGMVLWAAAGVIVIGGVWPTFLDAIVGAGFGKPHKSKRDEDKEYLARFGKGRPEAKASKKTVSDAARRQLDELNAALSADLAPAGEGHHGPAQQAEPEAMPSLLQGSDAAAPAVTATTHEDHGLTEEELRNKYKGGDFYPVARGEKKV